jgi:hypothetical protein
MYKKTTKIKTIKEMSSSPLEDDDDDEVVEGTDVVILDVPLLIRLLEYAREDASSDADLHNLATKLIAKSNKRKNWEPLTMKDYETIVTPTPETTPA